MLRKKIIICGGHLTPAIAVLEKIQEENEYEIIYAGRKNALEGDNSLSLEYQTIKKLKIEFRNFNPARLQRAVTFHTIPSLLRLPFSLIAAYKLLQDIKPSLIISFGGYIALPLALVARFSKIPVITHEQTHIMGLSNRIISLFANKICLSWEDTQKLGNNSNIILTGNPIRKSIYRPEYTSILNFGNKKLPLIYITGGSLGSRSINNMVKKIIPDLVRKFRILHQCGHADNNYDYQKLIKMKTTLPEKYSTNYSVIGRIDPNTIGNVYNETAVLVGRSGANTTTEIILFQIPAILIPLPWAGGNEQMVNAQMLQKMGVAMLLNQEKTNSKDLLIKIDQVMAKYKNYKLNFKYKKNVLKSDAAEMIYRIINKTIKYRDIQNN